MSQGPATTIQLDILTTGSVPHTLDGSDVLASAVFGAGVIRRVYCNAAGTLAIKRQYDAAFAIYNVTAGQYVDGWIVAVGGTGSGSSALSVVFES